MTMSETRTVTATFTLNTVSYNLTVSRSGTGRGTITSSPIGISCGYDCSQSYASGTEVTLTAVASSGTVFTGWSGACEGTSTTCQVTMSSSKTVTASFISMPAGAFYLGVTKAGTGTGTVTSAPQGITCGTSCAQIYASGILLKLTAATFPGFHLYRLEWCLRGYRYCWVTMSEARVVIATFSLNTVSYNLNVSKSGNGTGTITSNPVGISCGTDCQRSHTLRVRWSLSLQYLPQVPSLLAGVVPARERVLAQSP